MRLQEAIDQGRRLAVAVSRGFEVLAAEVYILESGVVYLDPGWSDPMPSSFRAHYMSGEVGGTGPWTVGGWVIREVDPETDPEYIEQWQRWESFKEETNATRERGAEYAAAVLDLEVRP